MVQDIDTVTMEHK